MREIETFVTDADLNNAGYITNELKPCPFCGCNKILTAGTKNENNGNIVYKAFCTNTDCMAAVHFCLGGKNKANESREGVVKKWNRRTDNK